MFEGLGKILSNWFTPTSKGNEPSTIDLASEGYSPAYASTKATEIRRQFFELREHGRVIADSKIDQSSPGIPTLIDQTCASIEKVLQQLKKDPNDFSRLGLSLESINPLCELVGTCARLAATGTVGKQMDKALAATIDALSATSKRFDGLSSGSLTIDDAILVEGLRRTVIDLNR